LGAFMTDSDITEVALDLIAKGGGNISPELFNHLNRDFDPNNRDVAFDTEIFESALKGFFFHGANGYAFSDIKNVFSFFNMTFDELYPEATLPFIKFATLYTLPIHEQKMGVKLGDTFLGMCTLINPLDWSQNSTAILQADSRADFSN